MCESLINMMRKLTDKDGDIEALKEKQRMEKRSVAI